MPTFRCDLFSFVIRSSAGGRFGGVPDGNAELLSETDAFFECTRGCDQFAL